MNSKLRENPHVGSTIESLLTQTGELEEVQHRVRERIIAYDLSRQMKKQNISPAELAGRMKTSRTAVYRILDPDYDGATIRSLKNAARAIGCEIKIRLVKKSAFRS